MGNEFKNISFGSQSQQVFLGEEIATGEISAKIPINELMKKSYKYLRRLMLMRWIL